MHNWIKHKYIPYRCEWYTRNLPNNDLIKIKVIIKFSLLTGLRCRKFIFTSKLFFSILVIADLPPLGLRFYPSEFLRKSAFHRLMKTVSFNVNVKWFSYFSRVLVVLELLIAPKYLYLIYSSGSVCVVRRPHDFPLTRSRHSHWWQYWVDRSLVLSPEFR